MHEDVERMNARWLQQIKSYNALTLLSRATLGAQPVLHVRTGRSLRGARSSTA